MYKKKFLIKNIKKMFFKFFIKTKNNKQKIKKLYFLKINIIKKNLLKKKIIINNLINNLLLEIFIIKNYNLKIFFFLKKILFKKFILSKIKNLFLKNFNLYKKKIKKSFFSHIKKKIFLIKKNFFIILFKNNNFNIKQYINNNFIKLIMYFLFIIKKINSLIFNKNFKIIKKFLKKYKKKPIYNDLYQECCLEFKKIIIENYNYKKNFFKFCYWKIKKKMISVINLKKMNNKSEILSMDKPLFYNSIKYFLSEKERYFLLEYTRNSLKNLIRELISSLPQREQKIIRLRFGIGHNRYYTLEEIGILNCLTKERIRQIELSVILKIRKPMILEMLEPYVKLLKALE